MQNTILYLITVLIWGSTWFVITFQLGDVHSLLSISYRFLIGAGILFLIALFTGRFGKDRFTARQHGFIALQGVLLFCLNYWLFYIATGYIPSGLVSLCFSTMTLMNIFNQALFFKLPIKKRVLGGAAIGLVGISLVFVREINAFSLQDASFVGICLALVATYLASLGNMASLRNSRDDMPIIMTNAYGMVYGAICCVVLALFMGAELKISTEFNYVWSLFYLGVLGSAVAFFCYLTLMRNIGADKASYAMVLFPIVALGISTMFEGFVWAPLSIGGVVLILLGNVIAMLDVKRPRPVSPRGG